MAFGLTALKNTQSQEDAGNAQGLQARQQAAAAIRAGALSNTPASPAKTASAPAAKARKIPSVGPVNRYNPGGAKYGDRAGEKRLKLGPNGEVLGSYKKGGKVKKTGVYRLHRGERVLNRKQTAKMDRKGMKAVLSGKA